MLLSLNIKDVVLIDRLLIEFKQGLCVLTGETGAGKSVLLDSLGLALGVRAEAGLIRNGANVAQVTAAFLVTNGHAALKILKNADITIEEDILLLRRVVYNTGKSRAYINDQPVSISLLKTVGDTLVEIHGQFETQGLLNPSTHIGMLDAYAKIEDNLTQHWKNWKDAELELHDMQTGAERAKENQDYIRQSLEDLNALDPKEGEEEQLSAVRTSLKHREAVIEGLAAANNYLNAEHDPIQSAWAELDRIADKAGDTVDDALNALARATSEMEEARAAVIDALDAIQDNTYNLEETDERLYALRMQARKHNCACDDLPKIIEKLTAQLDTIENAEEKIRAQAVQVEEMRKSYMTDAQKRSEKRQKTAQKLNSLVQKELSPLKLEKAKFLTEVTQKDEVDWSASGIDQVRFLVSTNPGTPPGLINKIASGGEMSRFMLALKVIIAQEGSTHSFIFDEVDTGIGGATADAVGERLARLAQSKQVLVVTHAPQVAARANHHWLVKKSGTKTIRTDITPLESRAERAEEIARMLAGADITPEARAAAQKLIDAA